MATSSAAFFLGLGVAVAAPHNPVVRGLVDTVFDPTWNQENSLIIWAVILVALFVSGIGFPLPEDIPLTLAGFTTAKQAHDAFVLWPFAVTFLLVATPILLGDACAYGMGRRYGFDLRTRLPLLNRLLTEKRMARAEHWFDEYGSFTVFLGRQIAGIRFVTFFTAGTMHMRFAKFVLFDLLGCLVSVPIWLSLGYFTARYGREWLEVASKTVGRGFLISGLIALATLIVVARIRSGRRQRALGGTTS